uniref:ACT domain-containing protein ACR n=1 Tax=Leersia perrieri TaxID=77586 RepID=A0A0D9VYK0_9ORYZ
MKYVSGPYFEPDFDPLLYRFGTPGVVIDNETREDCTLVKVDSVNRDGVLLEMVQLLTDLDLVISKSYISSDGGWLMDGKHRSFSVFYHHRYLFHVTDQMGRKLTDPSLPEFIQRALVPFHRNGNGPSPKFTTCLGNVVGPGGPPDVSDCAALEFTVHDRPGLLSSITQVLADNGCHVASGQAWTHSGRAAGVLYVVITNGDVDPTSSHHLWERIEGLVDAVLGAREKLTGERHWVKMTAPGEAGRVHTQRRLHQLMHDDRDYESGPAATPVDEGSFAMGGARVARGCRVVEETTRVSIESWEERGYAVVKMTSRDRPKLLFDTVCALTDMSYVVFHATVGSQGPLAIQEYYIRHKDGRTVDGSAERQKGVKVEVRAADRSGLLSDFTRMLREHGLSLLRVELKRRKEEAVGTFYLVTDSGGEVRAEALHAVRARVGKVGISFEVAKDAPGWTPVRKTSVPPAPPAEVAPAAKMPAAETQGQERPRSSLGSLLWSHLGKLSNNFGSIRS